MSCKICGRSIDEGVYCKRHNLAYKNLEEGYQKWRYALDISWINYLEKIGKTSGTGRWVKEVVSSIMEAQS